MEIRNNGIIFKKDEKTIINLTKLDERYDTEKGYKVDIIVEENPKDNIPEIIAEIEYDIDSA